jgi:hypothetical protein
MGKALAAAQGESVLFRTSHFGTVRKAVICSALMPTAEGVLAASEFTFQRRVGYTSGDQWEPVLAADARAHIYIFFPQYGLIAQCRVCTAPTMALSTSNDDGVSWDAPRPLLTSSSGQFDAQTKVDPVDRETLYASWLQGKHDVIVGRSQDFGHSWYFSVAQHSPEVVIDKPVLGIRGPDVYVSFNYDHTLAVASSHDYGQNFSSTVLNPGAGPSWSLAAGAAVDPTGNVYFSWTAYPRICGIGYALAANSCEGVSSVDTCTVAAPDAITAFAVPNPNCSSQNQSVFRVWLLGELPRQADHPAYFGSVNVT